MSNELKTRQKISSMGSTPEEFARLGLTLEWGRYRQDDGRLGDLVPMFRQDGQIIPEWQVRSIILRFHVQQRRSK